MTARHRRLYGAVLGALTALGIPGCATAKYYPKGDTTHPHATVVLYRRFPDDVCEAKLSPFRFAEYQGQTVRWLVINQCKEEHKVEILYTSWKPHNMSKDKEPTNDKEIYVTVQPGKSGTMMAKLKDRNVDTTYDYKVMVVGIGEPLDPELVIWP